ncbi:hypothetical protein PR048_004780 [Dryococelus australis]|uniref:Uncharacterized protein n=1 Tax=Dryococelus australis TaxID=614101 RepID=A0ABQ9I6D7_9NEOP|nr:hypothetical protein PR048_004780 [Dryococelus australis]
MYVIPVCCSTVYKVAERLACSPPTKSNRVQPPAGSIPDFHIRKSCRTMPLVGGYFRGIFRPPPLIPGAAPYSPQSPVIGSQESPKSLHSRPKLISKALNQLVTSRSRRAGLCSVYTRSLRACRHVTRCALPPPPQHPVLVMALTWRRVPVETRRVTSHYRPATITVYAYLNTLQESIGLCIAEMFCDAEILFKQEGIPRQYHHDLTAYVDATQITKWTGRTGLSLRRIARLTSHADKTIARSWRRYRGRDAHTKYNQFAVTSNILEALLKFYFQDIPQPLDSKSVTATKEKRRIARHARSASPAITADIQRAGMPNLQHPASAGPVADGWRTTCTQTVATTARNTADCNGAVTERRGSPQNGSGQSSVTSPIFVSTAAFFNGGNALGGETNRLFARHTSGLPGAAVSGSGSYDVRSTSPGNPTIRSRAPATDVPAIFLEAVDTVLWPASPSDISTIENMWNDIGDLPRLRPYRKICSNCERMSNTHGIDYRMAPLKLYAVTSGGMCLRTWRLDSILMEQRRNGGGAGKQDIPEKSRRQAASSGTIPTCENTDLYLDVRLDLRHAGNTTARGGVTMWCAAQCVCSLTPESQSRQSRHDKHDTNTGVDCVILWEMLQCCIGVDCETGTIARCRRLNTLRLQRLEPHQLVHLVRPVHAEVSLRTRRSAILKYFLCFTKCRLCYINFRDFWLRGCITPLRDLALFCRALVGARKHRAKGLPTLLHNEQKLDFTVLYILEPVSFLHWLLRTCEVILFLIGLLVTGLHKCEVFIYWRKITQGLSNKVWFNETCTAKSLVIRELQDLNAGNAISGRRVALTCHCSRNRSAHRSNDPETMQGVIVAMFTATFSTTVYPHVTGLSLRGVVFPAQPLATKLSQQLADGETSWAAGSA